MLVHGTGSKIRKLLRPLAKRQTTVSTTTRRIVMFAALDKVQCECLLNPMTNVNPQLQRAHRPLGVKLPLDRTVSFCSIWY